MDFKFNEFKLRGKYLDLDIKVIENHILRHVFLV